MGQAEAFYTLEQVCSTLAVEKSRIRFIEREFGLFFGFERLSPFPTLYTERQMRLLRKINALLERPDLSVGRIRSEFRRLCLERGKGVWVVTVTSGKGGVGKTSLAVNLSVLFARSGLRTVLLDADLGLANAHILLGVDPPYSIADLLGRRAGIREILVDGPCGLKLIPGAAGLGNVADLEDRHRDHLIEELTELRKMTDILVIDTSAGITRNVLKFIGLADEVLVIATPNIASTLDAFGLLRTAVQQQVPGTLNLLINRVTGRPQADEVFEKLRRCADDFLGHPISPMGHVQEDPHLEAAIQHRTPVAELYPETPAVKGMEEITRCLLQRRNIWKGGKKTKLLELIDAMAV